MRVVVTADAVVDLDEIFAYVAEDSVTTAVKLVERLRDKALRIGHAPRAYVRRPEYGDGVRCAFHKSYVITFQIVRNRVEILHIVRGDRDLARLFGER